MAESNIKKKPRLLIADDHSIMLEGLRQLLERSYDIVGLVEDGRALVESAERLQPDLVLLDISMPLLNGLDAARQIKRSVPNTKLLFLTMHASPVFLTEALEAGASGYLLKQSAFSELSLAIEGVLAEKRYISPNMTKPIPMPMISKDHTKPKKSLRQLTPRQREVLQLLTEGHSPKNIAHLLHLSIKTVEYHKMRLMEELDLHTTLALAKFAIAEGLVSANSAPS